MAEDPMPPTLAAELNDMKRRLANLERSPRLTNASISDDAGVQRVILGKLPDGDFGIEVRDAASTPVFKVEGTGLTYPGLSLASKKSSDAVVVTSGTFVPAWETVESWVTHNSIRWYGSVVCDAATTAEARLYAPGVPGAPVTSTVSLPAGVQTEVMWSWKIPGLPIGAQQLMVQLMVRRTGGAGNVNVYAPYNLWAANDTTIGATPTGV